MKPEDLPRFLDELDDVRRYPDGERAALLLALFQRFDFAAKTPQVRNAKRRCRVPAVTLVDLATIHHQAFVHGYARSAFVPETTSRSLVWCPRLNTLVLRLRSYTDEDTYNRIPSTGSTNYMLLDAAEAAALVAAAR